MSQLPYVVALCPTFRHPELLANSLALWLLQDYPLDRRMMVILDDGQTFDEQVGQSWKLISAKNRFPTISHKYNLLLEESPKETSIYCVWEDDDLYLIGGEKHRGYISSHVAALEDNEFSKSDVIVSDYTRQLAIEGSRGRFHSSLAFRRELIERIGGWPDTKRADFDQQLMSKLYSEAMGVGKPWPDDAKLEDIPFIYRWHSGAAHCQSTMDKGGDDETWYDRGEQAYAKVPFVGKLVPKLDTFTREILLEGIKHLPQETFRTQFRRIHELSGTKMCSGSYEEVRHNDGTTTTKTMVYK